LYPNAATPDPLAPTLPEGPPDSTAFFERVFTPMVKGQSTPPNARCPRRQYAIAVLTEFLLSQQQHSLPTNAGIGTLALMLLGEQGSFYQMHQLVQFMLVPDSIELAMRLLSFEPKYPPAAELAIDMLQRLGPGAVETLMECLMRRGLLLAACRLLRSQRMVLYPARRLLQAAFESGDATLFAAVYTHFEQRNEVWRGSKAFQVLCAACKCSPRRLPPFPQELFIKAHFRRLQLKPLSDEQQHVVIRSRVEPVRDCDAPQMAPSDAPLRCH
jgi:hypothetical protein